jgi:hypothetical protein
VQPRPDHCFDARAGRAYYLTLVLRYAHLMGQTFTRGHEHARNCKRARELATIAKSKARAYRHRYERWADDWNWRAWLPDKWRRIGTCETGLDWRWNSGTYQGAFGFYWGSWDAYKPAGFPAEAYEATPRQQWIVAERIRAAVGYGAWGCANA